MIKCSYVTGTNSEGLSVNKIILDPPALAKLDDLKEGAEICDETGRVVGYFRPAAHFLDYDENEMNVDDEELERIEQNLDGRPLREIIKDLEAKS
jgi:hypothetical protein